MRQSIDKHNNNDRNITELVTLRPGLKKYSFTENHKVASQMNAKYDIR